MGKKLSRVFEITDEITVPGCLAGVIAKCQGFESEQDFIDHMPILWDSSSISENYLAEYVLEKSKVALNRPSSFYLDCALEPFPMVAHQNSCHSIEIDWKSGEISNPTETYEQYYGSCSYDEMNGRCTTYHIGPVVYENDIIKLRQKLQPLVDEVSEAFVDNEAECDIEFSIDSIALKDEITDIMSCFELEVDPSCFDVIEEVYEDLAMAYCDVDNDGLTEVTTELGFLLSHETDDVGLRRQVGEYIGPNPSNYVNEDDLLSFFETLREMCKDNFSKIEA